MKKWIVVWSACFFAMMCGSVPLHAQDHSSRYSFDFRGIPLGQALEQVAAKAEIDMVYDPSLVQGITVYERVENVPINEVLRGVLGGTQLDFVILSSGTIVIVEKVNEKPAYGSYSGKVVDDRSGEPLPGATILLADASGGTSTAPSGTFAINKLMSGTYKIIFSYVGYQTVSKTITIKPQQDLRQKVSLRPKPVDFAPIVVKGDAPRLSFGTNDGQSVNPNRQWQTGRITDAIRSLSLFSGVQYGLPLTDLHLQGSRSGSHRIMLDGVPVYNPRSFGQMFSAFSPYAINRVQLYKAGYGVEAGSQIAGVINMQHDMGSAGQNRALVQADPLSVNLRGDLAFPLKESGDDSDLKVMGAARFNYWDLFKDPILDRTLSHWNNLDPLVANLLIDSSVDASLYQPREQYADVRFYDFHLASKYKIDSYKTLNTSFYLGQNTVNTDLLEQTRQATETPEYLYARDKYHWNNFMGQMTYNQLISPRLDLGTQLSFSTNSLRHRYLIGTNTDPRIEGFAGESVLDSFQSAGSQNLFPSQQNANRIQHLTLQSDANYSVTPKLNFEAGLKFDRVNSRVDFSDLFYLPTLTDQTSTLLSTYLNGHWRTGTYWKFTVGNRLTYTSNTNTIYSEPRAGIQYDRQDSQIGYWSARLAGGLYRQFINQYEVTNPGPTSLVPSFTFWSHAGSSEIPKAWHLSGSFHLEPNPTAKLDFEAFYKWQPTTYTVSYKNLLQGIAVNRSDVAAFSESTQMKALGAGFRFEQSFADRQLQLLLGYDYSFARINLDTQFGRALPPSWNEPHRLQLRSLWHVISQLTAVAKWQGIWGRSWGFRQSYYNYLFYEDDRTYGSYSFDSPENDRMRPFCQLDFALIYKPEFWGVNMEIRANLNNVLDRRNTVDWSLRPKGPGGDEYEIQKRTMPGFSPSLSIQMNF